MMKRYIFLTFLSAFTYNASSQQITKAFIQFELSGGYETEREDVNQTIPYHGESISVEAIGAFGFRITPRLLGYIKVGYGYHHDTSSTFNNVSGDWVVSNELLKSHGPILGAGFKRLIQLPTTPIYFTLSFEAQGFIGKSEGMYPIYYRDWPGWVAIESSSKGTYTRFYAGMRPGLMLLMRSNMYVELMYGLIGYTYEDNSLEVSNGFDMNNKVSRAGLDFSPQTLGFRMGYFL